MDNKTPKPKKTLAKDEQLTLTEKLQGWLLQEYESRLESGDISDTGLSSLQKLLMQNGWSLDPSRIPQGLRDKLTSKVDPTGFDDDDSDGVLPFRKGA